MKSRYVLVLGVLLLGVVLFMRPAMSSAAAEPIGAVQAPASTTDQAQPATPATAGQDVQQLAQACIDAHKLPAAEQDQAMSKMMSDPNLAGATSQMMNDPSVAGQMSQFMNSPEGRGSMGAMMSGAAGSMMGGSAGSMMSGWQNSQNGGK